MITTNIMGGLGNQMFQIFNAISYAIDNNTSFVFPNNEVLYAGENTTLRHAYWNSLFHLLKPYLLNENEIHYEIKIYENYDSIYKELQSMQYIREYFLDKMLSEKNITINYSIDPLKIYLTGYFQSHKYFQHNYNKIINLLGFDKLKKNILQIVNDNLIELLEDSISLHFRIGDFVKYTNINTVLSDNYYVDSIKTVLKLLKLLNQNNQKNQKESVSLEKQYNIIYFCENEDINIVLKRIENIQKMLKEDNINNCVFIKSPSILEDWQEMLFMSLCKHNIIANSSFSWWGAYLNENPNKIVCYSSIYYSKNYNKKVDDLFPDNWVKIQTEHLD